MFVWVFRVWVYLVLHGFILIFESVVSRVCLGFHSVDLLGFIGWFYGFAMTYIVRGNSVIKIYFISNLVTHQQNQRNLQRWMND